MDKASNVNLENFIF